MSDLLDNLKALADELREFNGETRKKAVQGSTNRPYYRESPANELKVIFDQLVATHETQIIACPSDMLFSTHRNRISQAKSYLLDHLDPGGYYKKLVDCIEIVSREKTRLSYIKFSAAPPMVSKSGPEFISQLVEWLNSNPAMHEKFELTGLNLSEADIKTLTEITAGLPQNQYLSAISTNAIIVARCDN